MKLTEEHIKALNLSPDDVILFHTPLGALTKEGGQMAFFIAEKVFSLIEQEKEADKAKDKALTEEEKIHKNKDLMTPLKRKFY